MPITRPTSEQILIKSQYTGDSSLDSYIEAMELNGEAAYDLLAKLIDETTGTPYPVDVELQENGGVIELRITANSTTGSWTATSIPAPTTIQANINGNPPTIALRDNAGTLETQVTTATTTGPWTPTSIAVSTVVSPGDMGTPLGGHGVFQHARDTTLANDGYTGQPGEITVDTTLNKIRLHDGSTAGGHTMATQADLNNIDLTPAYDAQYMAALL